MPTYKSLKVLATLVVFALLVYFRPELPPRRPSQVPWLVLAALALTYGISLFLPQEARPPRRWAIAYLVFTGFYYLLAGIQGLPSSGFFEAETWDFLISPFPLLTLLSHGIPHSARGMEWGEIYVLPQGEHPWFSATVVAVSLVAIAAAFAMTKRIGIAYLVWLGLVVVCAVATLGYVVAAFAGWGVKEAVWPICCLGSYVTAFVIARRGVDLRYQLRPNWKGGS